MYPTRPFDFLVQALVASSIAIIPVTCQITGTYSVQLVRPSGAPSPGNGTDLKNYPKCALSCASLTVALGICSDPRDVKCECSPGNRGNTTACQALTCNDADYLKTESLSSDVCGKLYEADPALSSSVSAAISSATSSAQAVLATLDPLSIDDLPECGKKCVPPALAAAGCNGLGDRECSCQCPIFNNVVGPCELSSCSTDDLNKLAFGADVLCAPVGGIGRNQSACPVSGNISSSATGTGIQPSATITPFINQGPTLRNGGIEMISIAALMGGLVIFACFL